MSRLNIVTVDRRSGEELNGTVVFLPRKVDNQFEDFVMINQRAMLKAISELNGTEMKVLLAFIGLCDFNNELRATQRYIGEVCEISPPAVSKAIKGLINKGYIRREVNIGGCKSFKLMPQVGWKGKAKNHKEALKQVGHLHA